MELEGKIFSILELTKGASAKGEWKRQNIVIETESDFPKKVCVSLWGAKVDALSGIQIGDKVSMTVDLESREFNGKWYTDVRASRIERVGSLTVKERDEMPPMPDKDSIDSIFSSEDDLIF